LKNVWVEPLTETDKKRLGEIFQRLGAAGQEKAKKPLGPGRWVTIRGKPVFIRGGRAKPTGASAAVAKYVPEANQALFDFEKGIHKAKDDNFNRANLYMYNPDQKTLLVGSMDRGQDHAHIQNLYAPEQSYDDFVKMRYHSGKLDIHIKRVSARSEKDYWNKSFEAAKVIKACGMPGDTIVRLLTGEASVTEVGLGEL